VSLVKQGEEPKTFTYDNVYDDDSLQKDVYNETAFPLVKSVMEGYNGTIFAYGQTGCGKTFTMEGVRSDPNLRGIIPRTFDQIFEAIATSGASQSGSSPDEEVKYLVAISYVEIYNEEVRDLLGNNPKLRLDIKEDPDRGVFIKGLSAPEVTSVQQIEHWMEAGNRNRSVGATAMNAQSSRSHSIFTVRIETSTMVAGSSDQHIKAGKLNLVDLAGSERQSKTEATGDRLKEAQKINLSLSALGNVISALVVASTKGRNEVHIPYRDSKLTRLLQDSLGGNTKTIMIAAVSPALDNYDETLSTLRYANRAKNIKNKPKLNEDPKDALLREFQDEIKRLKALLEEKGMGGTLDDESTSGGGGGGGGRKKKALTAGGDNHDDDEEEEEEDEDAASRPKKVKKKIIKKKKPAPTTDADGTAIEDIEEEDEEEEEEEEIVEEEEEEEDEGVEQLDENGNPIPRPSNRRRSKKRSSAAEAAAAGGLLPSEARVASEQAEAYQETQTKLQNELEKHSQLVLALETQLKNAKQEAAQEVEQRLQLEKAEHEQRARELEEELHRNKEAEEARLRELQEQLTTIQNQGLSEKIALKNKLKKLQQKLLRGGAQAKSAQQQAEEASRLLAEREVAMRQAEAREREERLRVEEEKLMLEEHYSSIKDEVIGKTRKLKKLKKKVAQLEEELEDSRSEALVEKESLMNAAREAERMMLLYKAIASKILTKSDLDRIVSRSVWDERSEKWILPQMDMPIFLPTVGAAPMLNSSSLSDNPYGGQSSNRVRQNVRDATANGWASSVRALAKEVGVGRDVPVPGAGQRLGSRYEEEKRSSPNALQQQQDVLGWKKSVTAGLDRESYVEHANGKVVSKMAAAAAAQAAQQERAAQLAAARAHEASAAVAAANASRATAAGGTTSGMNPSAPPPTKLSALDGVSPPPAMVAGNISSSPAGLDAALAHASQVPKRAAFDRPNVHGRRPSSTSPGVDANHDHVLSLMDSTTMRASFSPGSISASGGGQTQDTLETIEAASERAARRPAFAPASGAVSGAMSNGVTGTDSSSALDVMNRADQSFPKRPAFEPGQLGIPGNGAEEHFGPNDPVFASSPARRPAFSPGGVSGFGTESTDPISLVESVPKRPAFNAHAPAAGRTSSNAFGSENHSTIHASLPDNLPQARSFQPASISMGANGTAVDPIASTSGLPSRPAFKPGSVATPNDEDDPFLAHASPPPRPSFQPASMNGFHSNTDSSSILNHAPPSRPAFAPASNGGSTAADRDLPNFPATNRPNFTPARI